MRLRPVEEGDVGAREVDLAHLAALVANPPEEIDRRVAEFFQVAHLGLFFRETRRSLSSLMDCAGGGGDGLFGHDFLSSMRDAGRYYTIELHCKLQTVDFATGSEEAWSSLSGDRSSSGAE